MFDPASGAELHRLAILIQQENRCLIREMRIEAEPGGVVLHGFAYNFHGKQIALREAQRRIAGPIVANRIEVSR